MDLTGHCRSVILAVDRILSSGLLVLVRVVDAWALSIKVWQNVGDVRRESPWLLEKIALGAPRGLEVILTAIEIGEEEVHLLHKSLDAVLLPVGAIPRPLDY